MATRRPRLKGVVTSLPARRKQNAANVDNLKPLSPAPSPPKIVASPQKNVASPRKNVASPRKNVASKVVSSPPKIITSPRTIVPATSIPDLSALSKTAPLSFSAKRRHESVTISTPVAVPSSPALSISADPDPSPATPPEPAPLTAVPMQESTTPTPSVLMPSALGCTTPVPVALPLGVGPAPAPAVDGIVPLAATPPLSLDTLKSEMLSARARALFDPLVPLPSPARARSKLRPTPRLPPASPRTHRSQHHGSASESEDEGRRRDALSGDTAPPSRHEATPAPAPAPPTPASPPREKHFTQRRNRGAPPERDRLTMYDLIFYNPTTNPIKPAEEETAAPPPAPASSPPPSASAPASPRAPAPQIKIGPDGQIVVDEQSLVLERTRGELSDTVVRESAGRGGRYTRCARTKPWSDAETVRFYRALAALGTDFSLMLPLFPDRQRRDLKMKFKKEERSNLAQVEVALSARQEFAADKMAAEFARERAEAAARAERLRREADAARRQQRERTQRARRHGYAVNRATRTSVELLPAGRAGGAVRGGRGAGSASELVALEQVEQARGRAVYELAGGARGAAGVAPGSLVCLTMPGGGGARVLQTYVAGANGQLAPVNVSPAVLGALASYIKSPQSAQLAP